MCENGKAKSKYISLCKEVCHMVIFEFSVNTFLQKLQYFMQRHYHMHSTWSDRHVFKGYVLHIVKLGPDFFLLRGIAEAKAFQLCMLMVLLGFYVFFPVFILSQLCQRVVFFVYVLTWILVIWTLDAMCFCIIIGVLFYCCCHCLPGISCNFWFADLVTRTIRAYFVYLYF